MGERFKKPSAVMLFLSRINEKGEEEILLQKKKIQVGWTDIGIRQLLVMLKQMNQ